MVTTITGIIRTISTSFRLAAIAVLAVASAALLVGVSVARADSDPAKETATAAQHAGLAAKATDRGARGTLLRPTAVPPPSWVWG